MRPWSLFLGIIISVSFVFTVSCVSKEVPVTETYFQTEYMYEYKTETYTATEDVVIDTSEGRTYPSPVKKWQANLYFAGAGSGTGMKYYGYEIDTGKHTRSEVKITLSEIGEGFIMVIDLTGLGQIPNMPVTISAWREEDPKTGDLWLNPAEEAWIDKLEAITTNPERVLVSQSMDADTGSEITFDATGIKTFAILANTWNAYAITNVTLFWADDIVEKRTVTKERRVSYQVPYQVEKQRTVTRTKLVPFWEAIF